MISWLNEKHPVELYEYRCSNCNGVLWLPEKLPLVMCYMCVSPLGVMRGAMTVRVAKVFDVAESKERPW